MPLLLPPLLLSACGGKDVPPEQYSSNDTALPALTSTLSSENIQFSHKEGSEDQPDSYVYSGLSSMTDPLPVMSKPWRRTAALRLTPTAL